MLSPLKLMVVGVAYYNLIGAMATTELPLPSSSTEIPSFNETFQQSLRIIIPKDYTYLPGIGAHKLHTKRIRWNDARLICKEEGGHLAVINSKSESTTISRLLAAKSIYQASVGFHDLWKEGEYETIDGKSPSDAGFNEWVLGEPNNGGGDGIENCGALVRDGRFNDIKCTATLPFVCEVPIPQGTGEAYTEVQYGSNYTQITGDNENTEILEETTLPTDA